MLASVLVAALTAELLRRGYRIAWFVALVYAVLTTVSTFVVTGLVVAIDFESLGAVTLGTGLLWAGEAVLLIAGRNAFGVHLRRRITGSTVHQDDVVDRVAPHPPLRRQHHVVDDHVAADELLLRPRGDDSAGVVGYRMHVGTVIGLADPVAEPGDRERLLAEFVDFAESQAAVPCLFSVSGETAGIMRGKGWRALQIAEDTLMDLPGLEFAGKKWQKIRTAMNKAQKNGTTYISGLLRDQPAEILTQVREISEQWVGEKELPEMGFTLGTVEEALDDDVRIALAVDAEGVVQAALSWLPVYRGGPEGGVRGWTLDLMRKRNGPGANNMVEFLIARSALEYKEEGADFLSLSGAPLARVTTTTPTWRLDRSGPARSASAVLRAVVHHFGRSIRGSIPSTCASATRRTCRASVWRSRARRHDPSAAALARRIVRHDRRLSRCPRPHPASRRPPVNGPPTAPLPAAARHGSPVADVGCDRAGFAHYVRRCPATDWRAARRLSRRVSLLNPDCGDHCGPASRAVSSSAVRAHGTAP